MRTLTIKGRDGQVRIVAAPANGDLSNILGDGETLIVPTMFMDSTNGISQRGYVTDDVMDVTDEERQRLEDARVAARSKWINRVNGAWKKKPTTNDAATAAAAATAGIVDTRERSYALYEHRLTNKWRGAR